MFGKPRPDFKKNRFNPPKGWGNGKANVAKRPEVCAKMRVSAGLRPPQSLKTRQKHSRIFKKVWDEQRDYMLSCLRKNSGYGRRIKYARRDGRIAHLMSLLEVRMARVLDAKGLLWEYNSFSNEKPPFVQISYRFRGREHRYFPDFLIKDSRLPFDLIEVKGSLSERDIVKLRAAERSGHRILLAVEEVIALYETDLQWKGLLAVA